MEERGSICPTNWSLPDFTDEVGVKNGTAPSYNNLTAAYGIVKDTEAGVNRILAMPLSFPRAGGFSDGGLNVRSSSGSGNYWSSRPSGGTNAHRLYFGSTANIYRYGYARRGGRSVRCVVGLQKMGFWCIIRGKLPKTATGVILNDVAEEILQSVDGNVV